MMTISHRCTCGAKFSVTSRRDSKAELLHAVFTEAHEHCSTEARNDVNEDPGGDVFAQAERAREHTDPEMITGFQRVIDW